MPEQLSLDWAPPPPATVAGPRLDLQAVLLSFVEAFWRNGPSLDRLQALGWTDLVQLSAGEVHGTGPSGIRTGFVRGSDPIALATSLAMGQLGMLWPMALPGYLKVVNQAWRCGRQASPH